MNWCLSMVLLFINVHIIRHKYRSAFEQVRLAPDWLFTLRSAAGVLASAAGIIITFTAPWTTLVTAHAWLQWIGGLVTGSLLLGVALLLVGQRRGMQTQVSSMAVESVQQEEQA